MSRAFLPVSILGVFVLYLLSPICYLLSPICLGSFAFAQNYRCDWSVVADGGGEMSSTAFRAGVTVGQTAIGEIAGTNYLAFIGFWQIDTIATGIKEEHAGQQQQPRVNALYSPAPNPCTRSALIRYSLAASGPVRLALYDINGKLVATLAQGNQNAGNYSLLISHSDFGLSHSRPARGIYFLKLRAGDFSATRKLIIE